MMITYIDKGFGLHDAVRAANHWLRQHNGDWQSSDDVAVQPIIDAYPISATRSEVIGLIDAHAKALRDSVVAAISPAEMASWPIKQAEARAHQISGNDADAPMLALEAQARGALVADLAAKVLGKAAQLSQLEAAIAGVAGKHCDAVKALGVDAQGNDLATPEAFAAVLAYDWRTGWPL